MIDPVAFVLGSFPIYWYALSYVVGFAAAVGFLFSHYKRAVPPSVSREDVFDLALWGFLGGIVGGRLGYVLLYHFEFFAANPIRIVWPFDVGGAFVGISGMSFFGAIAGGLIAVFLLAKKRGWDVWRVLDFLAPAVPIGIFFGRIGNFLGGELYGRPSSVPWAMDFGDGTLRHPSQLYEALLEGVVLFAFLLWFSRRRNLPKGAIAAAFLGGYGIVRFFVEFFREPDAHLGFVAFDWMTFGQALSLLAVFVSGALWLALDKRTKQR